VGIFVISKFFQEVKSCLPLFPPPQISTCINKYVVSDFDTNTTTIDRCRYGDVGQYMMN